MTNKTKTSNLLFLILSAPLAWGFSWPMMKLALQHIPPMWMGALRMALGSSILFTILFLAKKKIALHKKEIPLLFSVGILQMGLFTILVNLGLKHVDAGRSAILVFTTPLWVTPIAVFVFKEKHHFLTWIGLLIGLLGVACLFNPLTFDWSNTSALYGNALLLLAAFVWSIVILHVRFSKHHRSPLELAPWQMLVATIFLTISALIFEPHPTIIWNWQFAGEMAYIGPIATALGFWVVIELNRKLSAVNTSLLLLAVPVVGLLSSAAILHEVITINMLLSVLLILIGLICVTLSNRFKKI